MKKILIPIGILVMGTVKSQLTPLPNTENYIQTKSYLDYNGTQVTKASETVQYFDGLGRPKQVVNIKVSPQGKDVVTHIEYDSFGRQAKSFLPVPQAGTQNGAIYTSPLGNASSIYAGEKIYSEKILENSPLDRAQQQIQVGNDWSTKPVKFEYGANIGNDVYHFVTTTIWENGATKSSLSFPSAYNANQLYRNAVIDEDENKTYEYKNGKGQVLLVRKMLSDSEYADTYYVYNEYDQLAFVIPPKAVNQTITEILLNDLCYQYRYDGRGRLVEKKLPGKGWESMLYDKQDRLVATQDTELKKKGQWLYTKYDLFGRVAIIGIGTGGERHQEQDIVNGYGSNNVNRINTVFFERQGMNVYYDNPDTTYPNSSKWVTLLSLNYYDSCPAYGFNPTPPANTPEMTVLTDTPTSDGRSTKGLPVMSFVKNIEDDNWTKNYNYYDQKARVIGTHSINHLGGYTRTESKLDFAGVPQQMITKHKRLNSDLERIIMETFEYDAQNRLLVHKHQVDSNPVEFLTQNKYNELSQLESKKVGGIVAGTPLQQIDYKYNIRGWMTKINDPVNLNGKLFGYAMKYNQVEGLEVPNLDFPDLKVKPKFNGNIAEVDWKTSTDPNDYLRRYGYVYDPMNRLSAGFYQKNNNPSAKEYFEKIDYDANGNIMRLKRSAELGQATSALIDNLTYVYTGNRLLTVTDNSTDYRGYPDTSGKTIGYDDNGNMINQEDKGLLNIKYNYLNLPDFILFNKTYGTRTGQLRENANYLYRADGTKLRKVYNYAPFDPLGIETSLRTRITEYLDSFQYESVGGKKGQTLVLKFTPTTEGYYNFENNKYIYHYTDHLGNVRLSYSKNDTGIEILEENNYYPFGMKHEGYNILKGNPSYNYKYNGKELQTETGMYDYGARMYMPDLGRWGVEDPLSEMYYSFTPYSYVANNPTKYTDPTGMWINIIDGETTYRFDSGRLYTQDTKTKKWNKEATVKNDSYAGKILSALNSVTEGDSNSFGSMFLGLFANDDINTNIQDSKDFDIKNFRGKNFTLGNDIYTGFGQKVEPFTSISGESSKERSSPFYVSLFHEIGHSWLNQVVSKEELGKVWISGDDQNLEGSIKQSEIAASYIENRLRSEQGLPIRTSYSPDAHSASTLVNSITRQPKVGTNSMGGLNSNINYRVFTMPNTVQIIYNKIMNSKK